MSEIDERCPACGQPSDDAKVAYWNRRWYEACRDLDAARELVRRAASFVNAVVVQADDKTPGLAWLADAASPVSAQPAEEREELEELRAERAYLAKQFSWEPGHFDELGREVTPTDWAIICVKAEASRSAGVPEQEGGR